MENKKSLIALALVALVGIVGGTFAYFTSSTTLTNEFETGTYSTSVTEEFVSPDNWTPGTTTKKTVNVTNNGSVEVAVRASYTEKWLAADKTTVLSGTRDGEKVAQFTIGSDWELATDGYYYYKGTLATGQTSNDFISSVTFNPNFELEEGTDIECTTSTVDGKTISSCTSLTSGYAGATYSLDITIETIQADKKWTYEKYVKKYSIGDEVTVAGETFNVIKDNGDTVTMLAQYSLDSTYRQNTSASYVKFSDSSGWTDGEDIDIQLYNGPVKTYVNSYVTYLQGETGDAEITGTLLTSSEFDELCSTNTCEGSEYSSWMMIDLGGSLYEKWWLRTSTGGNYVAVVSSKKAEDKFSYSGTVRPVITISKSSLQ